MHYKVFLLALWVSACGTLKADFWNEYKIDIQQGNVLTQDSVSLLKKGLSKAEVQQILGTPALKDVFHQNRWDYPYQYIEGQTGKTQSVVFSVFFDEQGFLTHASGNVQGEENLPPTESKIRLVELGKLSEEEAEKPLPLRKPPTLWEQIKNFAGF